MAFNSARPMRRVDLVVLRGGGAGVAKVLNRQNRFTCPPTPPWGTVTEFMIHGTGGFMWPEVQRSAEVVRVTRSGTAWRRPRRRRRRERRSRSLRGRRLRSAAVRREFDESPLIRCGPQSLETTSSTAQEPRPGARLSRAARGWVLVGGDAAPGSRMSNGSRSGPPPRPGPAVPAGDSRSAGQPPVRLMEAVLFAATA
jgi:hypothetical protein